MLSEAAFNLDVGWPAKVHTPFLAPDDQEVTDFSSENELDSLELYKQIQQGYQDAADWLVHICCDKEFENTEHLFRSVAFLYRHSLEMALKSVLIDVGLKIRILDKALDRESRCLPKDWRTSHCLTRLFDELESQLKVLSDLNPKIVMDHEQFEACRRVVSALDQYDPSSDAFRYGFDRNGMPKGMPLNKLSMPHFSKVLSHVLSHITDDVKTFIDEIEFRTLNPDLVTPDEV